ncbi:MAG: GatB/YqeY domain-containing protein [Candidatus Liptonbacteria bacterium]|nr:GatB/YqeY domain-containing protein [Candidatus Liptonbacteria bacterium]
MALREKLASDLKAAMKAGEAERVGVLRMVQAAVNTVEIEKRASGVLTLTDEEVLKVLERESKKRREAAELYTKGNRADLAEKELKEAALIAAYLPPQATDAEIEAVVQRLKEKGATEFSTLMKGAMQELKGKAEGQRVGACVKKALGE